MQSTQERKKSKPAKALLPSFTAELRRYDDIYQVFCKAGYSKELCEMYASAMVGDLKKPDPYDIIETAKLYDKIHDISTAYFYIDKLSDKKLSGDDKYEYCIEMLKLLSKKGKWRDAVDFRTENINFLQNYSAKLPLQRQADLYIALALVDCAAKKYDQAFRMLMGFGYKPQGKNDTTLLEILITGVYICACSGDSEGLSDAMDNAHECLKIFKELPFDWSREYYENCIEEASERII